MNKVIDLYHEDTIADWRAMLSDTAFFIHKICQHKIDEKCKERFAKCESEKMPYWGFVFLNRGKFKNQIDLMIDCVKTWNLLNKKYFIGLILDIEDHQGLAEAEACYAYLYSFCKSNNIKMGIYYGHQDSDKFLPLIKQANKDDVFTWCARYNTIKPAHYDLVDLWQFSDKELTKGLTKGCDCSRLTGRRALEWFTTQKKGVESMAVRIGSARINENGKVSGGAKGDQTGNEVGFQNWYLHSKGWVVIRPKDAKKAEKIAECMEKACNNNKIGYCQDHRYDLLTASKPYGYDPSKVTTKVEVDCSALVRVCCKYAGINVGDFSTYDEKAMLKATKEFEILESSKYCSQSAYLKRGDILVTKTKGHTVVVLSNGSKANSSTSTQTGKLYDGEFPTLPSRGYFKNRDISPEVCKIKKFLNWAMNAGLTETNKNYFDLTVAAVKAFQKKVGITADGEWGKNTQAKAKSFRK